MNYTTYILYSKKLNRFYVGHTSNLENRLDGHNSGESTYTSQGLPWILLWSITKPSFRQAEELEFKLKNLSKSRKVKFMKKYPNGIRDLDLLNSIESKHK